MSQNPSPSRPPDPTNEGTARVLSATGGDSSSQVWKFIALALGLVLLGVLVFSWYPGSTPEQAEAPQAEEQATDEEAPEEEAAPQEKPAPAPAPPPVADEPRPSSPRPSPSRESDAPQIPPALLNVHVLSVGYSALPSRRVVALRIGGGLPYFLREGDTIGDMKILAILTDRVQVSQGGKTYDILVAQ